MRTSALFLLAFALILSASCRDQSTTNSSSSERKPSVHPPVKSTLQRSFFLKHDFGVVDAGQKLTCSLELKNDSDKPMSFGFNSTSCGACISVTSMPKTIEPGESGIFELEFDTTGKRGATPQHAYFWDAEPKTLLVAADITATVRAVWTDPETIGLGNLSTSEPHKSKLYVMVAGLPDAKVTSMECDAPWLSLISQPVETSKELKSQNIHAIDYCEIEWTGKDAKPGNLSTKISFQVQKGDEGQKLEVSVNGYLFGDVEIIPAQIVFGRVAKDEVVRTCKLTFKKRPDISRIQYSVDHESVKVELAESKDSDTQIILMASFAPPTEKINQLLEGTIVGKNEAGEAVFNIPYIAFLNTSP